MILADMQGNVVAEYEIVASSTPERAVSAIRRGANELLRKAGISKNHLLGIGIEPGQRYCGVASISVTVERQSDRLHPCC